jgi:hypothetical protein
MPVSAEEANGCPYLGRNKTKARDPDQFRYASGWFGRPGTARMKEQRSIQPFSAGAWSHGPGSKTESLGVGGKMSRSSSSLVIDLAA